MNSNRLITAIAVALITAASWLTVFDARSTEYVDGAIVQSTGAFAVARGLNAIISTAQSTQVSFSIGAGLSMTVGEMLDPLNDLVEQYSTLMKVSIISLVIQKLLLEITTDTFFKIAITASGLLVIAGLLIPKVPFQTFLLRALFSLVLIRFILVFTVLANGIVEQSFLSEEIETETKRLQILHDENQDETGNELLSSKTTTELTARQEKNKDLIANLAQADFQLTSIKEKITNDIAAIDSYLNQTQSNVKTLDRIIRKDEATEHYARLKSEYQKHIEATQRQLQVINHHLEETALENEKIKQELKGRPSDWLGQAGRWISDGNAKIASMLDQASIKALKEKLDKSVESILRLMALFIFKTLILPLLFMAALMWGARQIDRVNLATLSRNSLTIDSNSTYSKYV